jgi:hypothetical protein
VLCAYKIDMTDRRCFDTRVFSEYLKVVLSINDQRSEHKAPKLVV